MGKLNGKVAIVTGGSKGIGEAIASALASEGSDLVLAARSQDVLAATAARIAEEHGVRVETQAGDLRTLEGCEALHATTIEAFGRADILINSAGATQAGPFLEMDDEVWIDGFALKFYAAVRCSRLFWPNLSEAKGSVVNIVGGFARNPSHEIMVGGVVNAALGNFSKALADLGLKDDVNVNAIYPGLTLTTRLDALFDGRAAALGQTREEFEQGLVTKQGIRRLGKPEDVAALALFLCTPEARHIQGTSIAVDGGATRGVF